MNALTLAFIGAPLVLGVVIRFRYFRWARVKTSMGVSSLVFAMVGVGYAFNKYVHLPSTRVESPEAIAVAVVVALVAGFWVMMNFGEEFNVALVIGGIAGGAVGFGTLWALLQRPGVIPGAFATVVFIGLGALNGLLGPVVAGFTLSATAHGFIAGEGLKDVFFWKDFFEFFEISTPWVKILVLLVTSLFAAADTVSTWLDQ